MKKIEEKILKLSKKTEHEILYYLRDEALKLAKELQSKCKLEIIALTDSEYNLFFLYKYIPKEQPNTIIEHLLNEFHFVNKDDDYPDVLSKLADLIITYL